MKNQHYQQILNLSVLFIFALFFMNCNSKPSIDVQGHRGCRGLFPENSLPAFAKAIDLGVHTLELDIAITKDKKVVVSHEPFMSKTICVKPDGKEISDAEDMSFNLYKMTHDEIKDFDCGTKFHPNYPQQKKLPVYKPLLLEVFELAKSKKAEIKFNIEIKSKPDYYNIYTPQPAEYVQLVLNEIIQADVFEKVNLQSFDIKILEEIKKQSPNMPVALLVDDDEQIWNKINTLSFKPEIISPYYKLLDKKTVRNLKAENFKVIPWTINSESDMAQFVDYEVDGIITDYPDKLIVMLKQNL